MLNDRRRVDDRGDHRPIDGGRDDRRGNSMLHAIVENQGVVSFFTTPYAEVPEQIKMSCCGFSGSTASPGASRGGGGRTLDSLPCLQQLKAHHTKKRHCQFTKQLLFGTFKLTIPGESSLLHPRKVGPIASPVLHCVISCGPSDECSRGAYHGIVSQVTHPHLNPMTNHLVSCASQEKLRYCLTAIA